VTLPYVKSVVRSMQAMSVLKNYSFENLNNFGIQSCRALRFWDSSQSQIESRLISNKIPSSSQIKSSQMIQLLFKSNRDLDLSIAIDELSREPSWECMGISL